MKPIIGCDIDGVIVDFSGHFLQFANRRLGLCVTYEESRSHDFALCLGVTYEEGARLLEEWEALYGCFALEPIEGAMESLQKLRQRYDIVAITGRRPKLEPVTREWFAKHLPWMEVRFAIGRNDRYIGTSQRPHKTQLAEKIGAICLIDDNEHEFIHWDSKSVEPICFAHPWNECLVETHPHIPRLRWPEITGRLMSMPKDRLRKGKH
jgi:uncharacterized HAD superfamily protein